MRNALACSTRASGRSFPSPPPASRPRQNRQVHSHANRSRRVCATAAVPAPEPLDSELCRKLGLVLSPADGSGTMVLRSAGHAGPSEALWRALEEEAEARGVSVRRDDGVLELSDPSFAVTDEFLSDAVERQQAGPSPASGFFAPVLNGLRRRTNADPSFGFKLGAEVSLDEVITVVVNALSRGLPWLWGPAAALAVLCQVRRRA